uniref:Protein zer-1 homolog n=1 Tax=Cyprinus carpio TaxID=7962 RepID=A0A8C1MPW4_CYPCA
MASKAGDDPESLMSLCTVFCLKNLRRTMCYSGEHSRLQLRPDVFLPGEICDRLVNVYMDLLHTDSDFEPQDGFFQLFSDPRSTRLTRLQLREELVLDRDLEAIAKQDLMELHLTYCSRLTSRGLRTLCSFRHSLRSLSLFGCSDIFFRKGGAPLAYSEEDEEDLEEHLHRPSVDQDFSFQGFNRLRLLNLGGLPAELDVETLLRPLPALTSLDLSAVHLPRPAFLTQWKERLASLVLYNVELTEELIHTLLQMRRLRSPSHQRLKTTESNSADVAKLVSLFINVSAVCLQLVITALKTHKYDKSIQVTGSAALFYLTNTEYRSDQSVRLRRQVIQVVLNGMEQYQEVTVQRNCCLTLCNFSIPEELEFQYHRVNLLLLKILEPARQDESIQRIAVHLCNALVCQVDNDHKEAVGKMGFVKTMLNLIQKKLQDRMCDQVMEFSWSALWNITDETPDNCQMFLECNGMNLFLECLKEFPDKQELHRNMLGLLGNVAEVKALRPQLLTKQFITVFSELLDSKADGIEVSYNACGVLAHIMFDGSDVWTMEEPKRSHVMDKMWAAIQSWDVSSRRNINYRSFEPILRLLPQSGAPVSQHWATWALYNLVSVYRE